MKTSDRFQAVTFAIIASLGAALTGTFGSAFAADGDRVGPLEAEVIETYRLGDDLDPCELTADQKAIRVTLARALDDRAAEIDAYLRATGSSRFSFSREVRVGPLILTPRGEKGAPKTKAGTDGWSSITSGWADFDKEFQAIRAQRTNDRWVRLLGLVRATIADDYRRAVRGYWMGASREGIAEASTLVKSLEACLNEKKCDDLKTTDAFKHALNLSPNSAADFADFRDAETDAAKARALKFLLNEIRPYADYFEPVRQRGVRISDPNTITISLDSADFRGYETEFGLLIEKFWKVGENRLKVEWMTSTRAEPLFKFLFLAAPGAGSQIDYLRRTITLGQGAAESIPAHEVGRALGFRARYFSVWHPETCKYEDQSKPDDLLSDGRTGSITAAHWDSLKKAYAPKK